MDVYVLFVLPMYCESSHRALLRQSSFALWRWWFAGGVYRLVASDACKPASISDILEVIQPLRACIVAVFAALCAFLRRLPLTVECQYLVAIICSLNEVTSEREKLFLVSSERLLTAYETRWPCLSGCVAAILRESYSGFWIALVCAPFYNSSYTCTDPAIAFICALYFSPIQRALLRYWMDPGAFFYSRGSVRTEGLNSDERSPSRK
ncbi:hypothetical protein BJ912DRAFT_458539 [Pholiota molesta]|nr:hypothetical protein BJ912DRAFT_458539 [Pholiota molesta]